MGYRQSDLGKAFDLIVAGTHEATLTTEWVLYVTPHRPNEGVDPNVVYQSAITQHHASPLESGIHFSSSLELQEWLQQEATRRDSTVEEVIRIMMNHDVFVTDSLAASQSRPTFVPEFADLHTQPAY